MGLWNVQTWIVTKGKEDKHEEIIKAMQKMNRENPKFGKTMKYFGKRWGPWAGRVLVLEFEDMADYESFFAEANRLESEEDMQLRIEWAKCIEYDSWKSEIWVERPLE